MLLAAVSEALVAASGTIIVALIGGFVTIYVTIRNLDRKNTADHGRVWGVVTEVKGDVADVKGDVAEVKGNILDVKQDVKAVKDGQQYLKGRLDAHGLWHGAHPYNKGEGIPADPAEYLRLAGPDGVQS